MRILLTGTTGQVGRVLLPLLQGRGEIIAPTSEDFNLARPALLTDALDRLKPDLIINPAAYTAVDRAEDEMELAFSINAEAPFTIASWAAPRQVPLVHFSSDYVFDGSGDKPWREESTPAPLSVYGASKLAGETAIRTAGGPHLIIRTSWVYAAKGANFLRTITHLAREKAELKIVADQIGAPTAARVIASATMGILAPTLRSTCTPFAKSAVVNVVCAGETSWHGFATAIVSGLKARGFKLATESIIPIKTSEFPTKAKRPSNSRLDLSRLSSAYGIVTPAWNDALETELDELARELI